MARPNRIHHGEANPAYRPALERFAEKCRFDATTGCVLWNAATSSGRGNLARYGSFWFEGKRWFAHRWAAIYIHGLALGDNQVGHCCPCGPNTLCVEHLEGVTQLENLDELNNRLRARRASQSGADRQHWLLVSLGYSQVAEPVEPNPDEIPFFSPPEWFRPFMRQPGNDDEAPF